MQSTAPTGTRTGVAMAQRSRDARATRDAEFTAYLEARQHALLRTAYLITGDPHQAEDVVQTALAKLYLAWDKVRDRSSVDAYARRIIVNENNSLWRRGWKRREHASSRLPDTQAVHDRYDEGVSDEVWALVTSLPRRARAVVVLRFYEQLTEAEVAETLGITVGTVKSQSSRALATLRERVPAGLDPRSKEEGR